MTWFLSSLMFNGLLEQGHLLTEKREAVVDDGGGGGGSVQED